MTDIVTRLRSGAKTFDPVIIGGVAHDPRMLEAADEIERLRAAPKVKPLVFVEGRNGYFHGDYGYQIAHNQGGVFRVRRFDMVILSKITGYERAVAWANEHHVRTIRAALTQEGE